MRHLLMLSLVSILCYGSMQAQQGGDDRETFIPTKEKRQFRRAEPSDRPPLTFYLEGFGHAVNHVSISVDRRHKSQRNGWGWRVGLGYSFDADMPVWSMPLGVNYLLGSRRHYFELGAGLTPLLHIEQKRGNGYSSRLDYIYAGSSAYMPNHTDELAEVETKTAFKLLGVGTIGYRYQPMKRGFSLGIGFSPVFTQVDGYMKLIPYWPYLRLGYTF